jgi:hypothetical protein
LQSLSCVQVVTADRRTVTSGSTPQALAANINRMSVHRAGAADHLGAFSIPDPSSSERVEYAASALYRALRR